MPDSYQKLLFSPQEGPAQGGRPAALAYNTAASCSSCPIKSCISKRTGAPQHLERTSATAGQLKLPLYPHPWAPLPAAFQSLFCFLTFMPFSMRKAVIPCGPASGLVLAYTTNVLATVPLVHLAQQGRRHWRSDHVQPRASMHRVRHPHGHSEGHTQGGGASGLS